MSAEPRYVAHPREPAPLARRPGLRPLTAALATAVLLLALVALVVQPRAAQDPSLQVPAPGTAPAEASDPPPDDATVDVPAVPTVPTP